jgi:uncharacterized protein
MTANENAINWFEIPVTDIERAKHFYQVALSIHMEQMDMGGMQMATFPWEAGSGKLSGALVQTESNQPSGNGTIVYLNANPDLAPVLDRLQSEGAQIVMPKTLIDEQTGYMAMFLDLDGNRVGLHSQH